MGEISDGEGMTKQVAASAAGSEARNPSVESGTGGTSPSAVSHALPVTTGPTVTNFLGIGLDAITYEELFVKVDRWIADKSTRSHHIACINAFCIALSLGNKRLANIYNGSDIAGPDGIPFVRWIRTFRKSACDRIAAPDTILKLAQHAKQTGYTFFLYGGHAATAEKMEKYLQERFPYLNIVGRFSPPFRPLSLEEDAEICAKFNRLRPDIVCVGLGTPKQDYWIEEHLHSIRGAVFVASGATFDFFGGRIRMAPQVVRESGFEWVYRLFGRDFGRLWKRYIVYHSKFLANFVAQHLRLRTYPCGRWSRPE